MDKKENKTTTDFSTKTVKNTEKFLTKYFKLLIGIVAAIIVGLIVLAIVLNVISNKKEANYYALDNLTTAYSDITALDVTSTEYTDAVATFNSDADALIASAKKSYPGYKAQYLKAALLADDEKWADALVLYTDLIAQTKDIYLGPLAMLNAAVCAENAGDSDKALALYNQIWDDYGNTTAVAPKALFNTGRLYESKNQIDLAKAAYQQLVDEFQNPEKGTDTEYAKLAKNRLAAL